MTKKQRRNIVCVGGEEYRKNMLNLIDIKEKRNTWNEYDVSHRFPHFVSIEEINDLDRHQGFLLILRLDDIIKVYDSIIDWDNIDIYEIDRFTRKMFKNFCYTIIMVVDEFNDKYIPYANTYIFEESNFYNNSSKDLNEFIDKLYNEYLNKSEPKFSKKRLDNIQRLKKYIQLTKKEYITTEQIMHHFKVNSKWVYRYMKDMNYLYNNIGYNYKKRQWYVVKNNYKNKNNNL